MNERALRFDCNNETLFGILSVPGQPAHRALLIVVGGSQYRAGSHRQFVLLARRLAQSGTAVLRFDYRGMGDSEGQARGFDGVGEDIRAAIDCLCAELPSVREVVLFGLCDGACAAAFHATRDARVRGLVLVNPWVRTERGVADAYLRHYYRARLLDPAFWGKLWQGDFRIAEAWCSLLANAKAAARGRLRRRAGGDDLLANGIESGVELPGRMLAALRGFEGRLLVILSGNDLTAQEFEALAHGSRAWRKLLADPRATRRRLADANHTFARSDWREQLAYWVELWLASR